MLTVGGSVFLQKLPAPGFEPDRDECERLTKPLSANIPETPTTRTPSGSSLVGPGTCN